MFKKWLIILKYKKLIIIIHLINKKELHHFYNELILLDKKLTFQIEKFVTKLFYI